MGRRGFRGFLSGWRRRRRSFLALSLALSVAGGAWPAWAADSTASLQFTVPAPDPVQAGDTLILQALAVNTGADTWPAGSYYWVAEIYGVDFKFLARTDQVTPTEAVAPGGVAAISLPYNIPPTELGRRLYRIYLYKDNRTLLQSDYKPFQIVEKAVPPPPLPVKTDYRLEGNVTMAYKDSSSNKWDNHNGSTSVNLVGKLKDTSYLLNAYLLHQKGNVVNPYNLLFNLYAPWGRLYAGDISPTYSQLSINSQSMRGAQLEQTRGDFTWSVLGGETVTSQGGTTTSNGRYARSIYGAKGEYQLGKVKVGVDAFESQDESASLSNDPTSNNFRGPTLQPQKNGGQGLSASFNPWSSLSVLADWQRNSFTSDPRQPTLKDTAYRGEVRFQKSIVRLDTYVSRTGPNFVSFGAPSVVGDRLTYDGALSVSPAAWYTLTANGDQYHDNLENDPTKTTTTQRVVSLGNAFQLPTKTGLNASVSVNSAVGKPSAALNNQTTTLGLGVNQSWGRDSGSLNVQDAQYKDATGLSHNLDTQTVGVSGNIALPRSWTTTLGVTRSVSRDKADGSARTSLTLSPSLTVPLGGKWRSQYWGTQTQNKNTSPVSPADSTQTTLNSEFTYTKDRSFNTAFGAGVNQVKDKLNTANNVKELTVSLRLSYSF